MLRARVRPGPGGQPRRVTARNGRRRQSLPRGPWVVAWKLASGRQLLSLSARLMTLASRSPCWPRQATQPGSILMATCDPPTIQCIGTQQNSCGAKRMSGGKRQYDVFIGFAEADRLAANVIVASFECAGIPCWIAARDLQPRADWASQAAEAIANSRCLVAILSRDSSASPWVQREFEWATASSVRSVPLRLDNVDPDASLASALGPVQCMDAFPGPLFQYVRTVVDAVHRVLGSAGQSFSPSRRLRHARYRPI